MMGMNSNLPQSESVIRKFLITAGAQIADSNYSEIPNSCIIRLEADEDEE